MTASREFAPRVVFDVGLDHARRCLKPSGELDGATAPILLNAAKAFMAVAVGDLTIDLAEVTFADSALLGALVDIQRELHAQGARLSLINEPACVLRLFLASGFRAVLAQ